MRSAGDGRSLVWRSTALRVLLALPPLWATAWVLLRAQPGFELLVAGIAAVTLASPSGGLLAVVAVAPFGDRIARLAGRAPFHLTDAIVLAFLGTWLLRAGRDRFGPRVPKVMAAIAAAPPAR